MPNTRRRVSYVLPPPTTHIPRLQLPPPGVPRLGATGPLLLPADSAFSHPNAEDTSQQYNHPRHRLGVASLALDTSTLLAGRNAPEGILYTGGRDGMVMSWDLGIPMKKRKAKLGGLSDGLHRSFGRWEIMTGWADDVIDEEAEDAEERMGGDGDVLGDVSLAASLRKKRLMRRTSMPFEREWETDLDAFKPGTPTYFRQCTQTHADWVNDILLCNYNQTVISASSDGTIKSWNPHSHTPSEPSTIGSHSDYVRCITHCRDKNWLASGSFDRTIKLWDLSRSTGGKPLMTLNLPDAAAPKSSIYAIAADPFGQVIASGSPERVIRIWDPRSGRRTGKLVGHTDNIRAILISEDARYLLTGSADASIKLWSLVSQRCLHTFTYHTDSVWSLFSDHPSLEIFYSGDKSGLVCRVDVEDCADISEGECIVLCQDTGTASSEGVSKVVAMDDNLLWTASSSSKIQRWWVPQRRALRAQALHLDGSEAERSAIPDSYILPPIPLSRSSESPSTSPTLELPAFRLSPSSKGVLGSSAPSLQDSMTSTDQLHRFYGREDETALFGIPLRSLVRLTSPNDPYTTYTFTRGNDPEVATLYSAASIMSVPRPAPSRSTSHKHVTAHANSTGLSPHQHTNTARADYEEREIAADATPLCGVPDDVIEGEHGLVRSVMLNDRIHALTVDTAGEVAVWDIVRAVCCGRYVPEEVALVSQHGNGAGSAGGGETKASPREALEAVRERIEGEAVVLAWSVVDTKTGVLSVHLNERCFEGEVYADEVGMTHDRHISDESRINIGKWVLRNVFSKFIDAERRSRSRHEPHGSESSTDSRSGHVGNTSIPNRRPSASSVTSRSSTTLFGSSTVVSSPKMIPAIPPSIPISMHPSPLPTPMMTLQPGGSVPLSAITTNMPVGIGLGMGDAVSAVSPSVYSPATMSTASGDYFGQRARQGGMYPGLTPGLTPNLEDSPNLLQVPSTPGGGFMGRLKNLGKMTGGKKPQDTGVNVGSPVVPENRTIVEEILAPEPPPPKTPRELLLSGPFAPPTNVDAPCLPLLPTVSLVISEESASGWTIVYRGTVASAGHDMGTLEEVLPMWLLEYLLMNRSPLITPVKIGFLLLPWNKDPDGEQLPGLVTPAHTKLSAHRFLRIRKLVAHVQDKLEKVPASPERMAGGTPRSSSSFDLPSAVKSSPPPKAEDAFEILCTEVVLPLDSTLAAVRQFVWRQSTDLVMYYRRKS